jgi:NAD(P)-dependent dehydrogenase (short-subunit alcohol dehydrogenase family)
MLKGKVVVLAGGAGCLGTPMAEGIVAAGGSVLIADLALDRARELAGRLQREAPGRAAAVRMDITSLAEVRASLAAALEAFGRVDALVNAAYPRNAEYGRRLEEVTYESFCANVDAHLGGYFLTTQQYAEHFAGHGGGTVINLSSIYGVIPPRFEVYAGTAMTMPVEYAAIKAGIQHLSRYFAKYYLGRGVRCNVLSPGGILDGQPEPFLHAYRSHCLGKGMLDRGDLVGSLVFLLSDAARHITGQNLIVDDGYIL